MYFVFQLTLETILVYSNLHSKPSLFIPTYTRNHPCLFQLTLETILVYSNLHSKPSLFIPTYTRNHPCLFPNDRWLVDRLEQLDRMPDYQDEVEGLPSVKGSRRICISRWISITRRVQKVIRARSCRLLVAIDVELRISRSDHEPYYSGCR